MRFAAARPALVALAAVLAPPAVWAQAFHIPMEVQQHMRAGNCSGVVKEVNRWLGQTEPTGFLLAGWVFERGICVKQDVEQAYAQYERAWGAGEKLAALRLAGLSATREGGKDVAAVLWWARRGWGSAGKAGRWSCDAVPAGKAVDIDSFVAVLKAWSQEQLDACRAHVGYRALVSADMRFPNDALWLNLRGDITVEFNLQTGEHKVVPGKGRSTEELARYVNLVATDAMRRVSRTRGPVTGSIQFEFAIE